MGFTDRMELNEYSVLFTLELHIFYSITPVILPLKSWCRSSSSSRRSERPDSKRTPAVQSGEDKEDWEAEQKRLDREWYGLDEGYDESHNPFSGK